MLDAKMNKLLLPILSNYSKCGLFGVHLESGGNWFVEEVRHYYKGDNNSIFILCDKAIRFKHLITAIKQQYSRYIVTEKESEFLLKVNKRYLIVDVYPDPENKSPRPNLLILFKDGTIYSNDVSRLV